MTDQDVKTQVNDLLRDFYSHRNGEVSRLLRSRGDSHTVIFGCTLAELLPLASCRTPSRALAEELWRRTNCREARLAAAMLFPPDEIDLDTALQMAQGVATQEEADVLCHSLLRKAPCAARVLERLLGADGELRRYTALRLALNLLITKGADALGSLLPRVRLVAETSNAASLRHVAASLLEEIEETGG